MSISSIVIKQDSINLRKLAEQQKNQRALKIENRILKHTHDIKLPKSLSPIIKNLDEVKETTQKLGEAIEKSQPENNIRQPAIEHTPPPRPIENNEGKVYDTELENTLKNMKNNTGFFQTFEDPEQRYVEWLYC